MDYIHIKKEVKEQKWVIINVRYPFSNPESALRIRKEKSCVFCGKKYKDCEALGVVMTDKGSKPCCDDCAKMFLELTQGDIVSGNADDFEKDLFKLINNYCKQGLKKPDLVKKMEWATGNCKFS